MKFREHATMYEKRSMYSSVDEVIGNGVEKFYEAFDSALAKNDTPSIIKSCVIAERSWYRKTRPYYKVWPGIASSLFRINLDCSASSLKLPYKTILLRFAVDNEPKFKQVKICTLLVSHVICDFDGDGNKRPILICVVGVERDRKLLLTSMVMSTDDDETVESAIEEMDKTGSVTPGTLSRSDPSMPGTSMLMKPAISILIMAKDRTFIRPDVLTADRAEYDRTHDPRLIEKARDRGVVGWRVGEAFETIPHIRRPHLGLRWTGEGRKIPKIVPIKGSIVHREKVASVPTGHFLEDNVEVE